MPPAAGSAAQGRARPVGEPAEQFRRETLLGLVRPKIGWRAGYPRIIASAEQLARLLIAPLLVAYRLRLISFPTGGQLLTLVPGALGVLVRRGWYQATLESCGSALTVGFGTIINQSATRIGHNCTFGEYNRVGLADIGDNFLSAGHVCITSGRYQHGIDRRDIPVRAQPTTVVRVAIGEDVWAGQHATIAAPVAPHTVIGIGAVVIDTFDEWAIIAGVPARVVGERP
jgi:acetyltransferase-like isoleucine patch superfamily enzyme